MLGHKLSDGEKSALGRLKNTPIYDLLLRMRTQADNDLRAHTEVAQLYREQGKAVMLAGLVKEIEQQSKGRSDSLG